MNCAEYENILRFGDSSTPKRRSMKRLNAIPGKSVQASDFEINGDNSAVNQEMDFIKQSDEDDPEPQEINVDQSDKDNSELNLSMMNLFVMNLIMYSRSGPRM